MKPSKPEADYAATFQQRYCKCIPPLPPLNNVPPSQSGLAAWQRQCSNCGLPRKSGAGAAPKRHQEKP